MKIKSLFILIFFLLSVFFIINKVQFDRLEKNSKNTRFPKIESTYKELFLKLDSAKLAPSYTYYSSEDRFPIASYTFENNYDLVIYKLPISIDKNPNTSLEQLVSISNISADSTMTENIIYDGSIKTNDIRFNTAVRKIYGTKKLNIYYKGKMTVQPIISDGTLSYSICASSLIGKYEKTNFIDFTIANRKKFNDFSLELTICKRKENIYLLFLFPMDNHILTEHTKILNYLIHG